MNFKLLEDMQLSNPTLQIISAVLETLYRQCLEPREALAVSLQVIRIRVSMETVAIDEWNDGCSVGEKKQWTKN